MQIQKKKILIFGPKNSGKTRICQKILARIKEMDGNDDPSEEGETRDDVIVIDENEILKTRVPGRSVKDIIIDADAKNCWLIVCHQGSLPIFTSEFDIIIHTPVSTENVDKLLKEL